MYDCKAREGKETFLLLDTVSNKRKKEKKEEEEKLQSCLSTDGEEYACL